MQRISQPLQPLKAEEPITESWVGRLAGIVNATAEARSPGLDTEVRWAITAAHSTDGYPAWSDNPIAYPFKWLQLYPKSGAPAGTAKPVADEQDLTDWEHIDGPYDSTIGINGYAVNLNETIFSGSTAPIDYIEQDTVILVASGSLGTHWIVREPPRLFLFKNSATITQASENASTPASGTYYSQLCDAYTIDNKATTGQHAPRSLGVQKRVINPAGEDIPAGSLIWAERCSGGNFLAIVWVCQ